MSIVNSEIREGVLLEQDYISIHVGLFEDLIRAETERDILEAVLSGEHKYSASEVLEAIQTARKKHLRGVMRLEIGGTPPADPEPSDEDADTAAEDEEDPNKLEPASEGSMIFADKQVALADRKQFVGNMGWLLTQTREGVKSAYLDDKDTVHVVFCKGGELLVNVTCDSYMAIIRDVANALR